MPKGYYHIDNKMIVIFYFCSYFVFVNNNNINKFNNNCDILFFNNVNKQI